MAEARVNCIFRVHRTVIGGQTVEIRLEPFKDDQVLNPREGDEFITGTLAVDPWDPPAGS